MEDSMTTLYNRPKTQLWQRDLFPSLSFDIKGQDLLIPIIPVTTSSGQEDHGNVLDSGSTSESSTERKSNSMTNSSQESSSMEDRETNQCYFK